MNRIFAPWRMEFIKNKKSLKGCVFCVRKREKDLVLFEGKKNFVLLNKYPYSPGHVMVAPYAHKKLDDAGDEEMAEHAILVKKSAILLKRVLRAEGLNIGMNVGRIASASIEDHMHTHIVPRWTGDTGFIDIIGETRVLPQLLSDTYKKLRPEFEKLR